MRTQYQELASKLIQRDLRQMQVSQRHAAKLMGIPHSTFNAFLNGEYRRQHAKTLFQLATCPAWSEDTRKAIVDLKDYERRLFRTNISAWDLAAE